MKKKDMTITIMTFAGMFGLVFACRSVKMLNDTAQETWVGVFFLLVAILIVVLSSIANFIIMWDDEKPQESEKEKEQNYLDTLEEVPVEEVN